MKVGGARRTKSNRRGRPSKNEELEIERKIQSCFSDGLSPWSAAKKTGHNVNTIKKYYNKLFREVRESESPEFVQACKDRKALACIGLESQLLKMKTMQNELEKIPSTDTAQFIKLCKLKTVFIDKISDLYLKIVNLSNSPTYDDELKALREAGQK